jgi:GT2 family glycosyltransferase
MPSGDPTFSVVVPTFRRPTALKATLAGLLAMDYDHDRYEVIVIDDGGDEIATGRVIAGFRNNGAPVRFKSQDRLGAARARNRGARIADGELVLFCDDDMLVEPSHLRLHLSTHRGHPTALVSGAWEFAPAVEAELCKTAFGRYRIELERRYQEAAGGEPLDDEQECFQMPLLGAGNLALSRELFWEIGGFDEDFPVAGAEDQDFSIRAIAAGATLILDKRIRCYQDDNRITLRSYCAREERSAQTVPVLARKYPVKFADSPYVLENRPVSLDDGPRLIAKKLLKRVLAADPSLAILHGLAAGLEKVRAPETLLRRYYAALLGIHLYRGFRQTWA